MTTTPIITPDQFDFHLFESLPTAKRGRGNPKTRQEISYVDIVTAFDIETTALDDIKQSIMYIWQWQFGCYCTVIGRTWEQFRQFVDRLEHYMGDRRLVVYVHNLSYEFQFLRNVHNFQEENVFAVDSRKVLRARAGRLEYRCSYLHSNMSLSEYTNKMRVEHKKLNDFEYTELRYPWTELTDDELAYCQNDVLGLVEAITAEMELDGDNLYTIPLTSTGYVRRDAKRVMRPYHSSMVKPVLPNLELYNRLRQAFRGGNTHANRRWSQKITGPGESYDISSSYPAVICNEIYPMGKFTKVGEMSYEEFRRLINKGRKAALAVVRFKGLRLLDPSWGCPYLSLSKCREVVLPIVDNGRIIEAATLTTTITDVDLRIIDEEYDWSKIEFLEVWTSRYGKLPQPLIDLTIEYYRRKTTLKGDESQKVLYDKSKALLNALYGMMAQNPVKLSYLFDGVEFVPEYKRLEYTDEEWDIITGDLLDSSNGRAFLTYQWGCWVTAWARYRLEEGLRLVHEEGHFLYCDTDSVKYTGKVDWSTMNAERIKRATASGAYATDSKGVPHYMGVFEPDGTFERFCTMGAKKYAYETGGKLKVTIAGVSKKYGAIELGCLENMTKDGFVFTKAAGLDPVYNDVPYGPYITEDGHRIEIGVNTYLHQSTYTLSIAADYRSILDIFKKWGIE